MKIFQCYYPVKFGIKQKLFFKSKLSVLTMVMCLLLFSATAYSQTERQLSGVDGDNVMSFVDDENSQQPGQRLITVRGRVSANQGEAVPGASVVVRGTTNGTVTDGSGNYSLAGVPANGTLVFTFVGMAPREVGVSGRTVINVTLEESTITLDEVVAVGYGVQRKSDLAGAVGVVKGIDLLRIPSFNAIQGLRGMVAGVNVFTNSGNPSGNSRVVIRGINSINTSTNPLYVVDGVQMTDFGFLNPNDIERIEVLKDASATAIYGARGANGVILVTTKRGFWGGTGTVMTYDSWMSVGTLAREVDVMNSEEFMNMQDIGFANFSKFSSSEHLAGMVVDRSDPLLFDQSGRPLYNTNWQREATRAAFSHSHQFSIQQEGESSATGVFLNYTDQQGIMLNSFLKRISARLSYDSDLKPWLSVGINLLAHHTWGNEIDETGGGQVARRTMLEMPSIIPVKFPDGSWSSSQFEGSRLNLGLEAMSNPVHELTTRKMHRFRSKIFGNLAFTFHLTEHLDLKTQIGVDANLTKDRNYSPTDLINISSPNGNASISSLNNYYWQEETYLTYNRTIDGHRINAVAGLSWSQFTQSTDGSGTVIGFPTDYFGYNNLGAGRTPSAPSSGWQRWSLNSFYLRGNYVYNEKYLATVTARIDGSSRFGRNNRYAFFPSIALGWIASSESFMSNLTWIDNLKVRASFGRTGNTEIAPYSTKATISSGTVLINGTRAASAFIAGLANPDLEWEKTDQFNIGLDLSVLENRFSLGFDYYYKTTSDLLLARPVPYSTGFSTVIDNIGKIRNQGMDIMLSSLNLHVNDFTWQTRFSANFNKNKILQLGQNNEDILTDPGFVGGNVLLRVGESLGSFYGFRRLGIWGTDEVEEAAAVGAVPGEAKRSAEREIIGKGMPDWTGSLVNNLAYKNWDFTLDIQFVAGVEAWQLFFHSMEDRTGIANGLRSVLHDAWNENNQNTMVQQIRQQNYSGQNSVSDTRWVSNGSYIRGNLIQVGYTMDKDLIQRWGFKRLRAYLGVSNAFLICASDFQGYDPEAVSNNAQFGQNIFFFQYPKPRTFTFGVNMNF